MWDQGRRQLREIGGGGGSKIQNQGDKAENQRWTWPKLSFFLNWIKAKFQRKSGDLKKKKGPRRNPKAFSGRNHKFKRFFSAKNSNFFLPKIYRGGQGINRGGGGKNENRCNAPEWDRFSLESY